MTLDSRILGRRVAEARQRAGLTQADLAGTVGLDRSGLAKIENGDRRLTALELARVAAAVSARIESFIEDTPTPIVSHRNVTDPGQPSPSIDMVMEARLRAVEFVAKHDAETRSLLRDLPSFALPENGEAAEEMANAARELLGADQSGPITNLGAGAVRAGVIAFVVELGQDSADAASALLSTGAVAVVNGSLKVGRRRLSLAHEVGHVLVKDEYSVDWRTDGSTDAGQREAILDRFARALLLPSSSVAEAWGHFDGNATELRTLAVRFASHFRVDMSTLARRLSELRMIDSSRAGQVRTIRTSRADIVENDLVVGEELIPGLLAAEYEKAILRLYRSEIINEARALGLLFGAWDSAELPPLPQLPESAVWQFIS